MRHLIGIQGGFSIPACMITKEDGNILTQSSITEITIAPKNSGGAQKHLFIQLMVETIQGGKTRFKSKSSASPSQIQEGAIEESPASLQTSLTPISSPLDAPQEEQQSSKFHSDVFVNNHTIIFSLDIGSDSSEYQRKVMDFVFDSTAELDFFRLVSPKGKKNPDNSTKTQPKQPEQPETTTKIQPEQPIQTKTTTETHPKQPEQPETTTKPISNSEHVQAQPQQPQPQQPLQPQTPSQQPQTPSEKPSP